MDSYTMHIVCCCMVGIYLLTWKTCSFTKKGIKELSGQHFNNNNNWKNFYTTFGAL